MKPKYVQSKKPLSGRDESNELFPKKEFSYSMGIFFGVATELVLIFVQYLLLALHYYLNPETTFSFSSDYMMSRGFYIFLIPGFILFATVVFFIMRKYEINSAAYLFAFLLAAAAIEIIFYLSIAARYQGPFLYSILDKVIGSALGAIGYYAIGKTEQQN